MYRVTFKHVLIELACVVLAMYLATAGVYVGWYGLDLREGWMLAWGLFVALPIAMGPYFLAQIYLVPSPFNNLGRIAR